MLQEFHGQRTLAGYSPWDCRVRHESVTELNWTWGEAEFPSPGFNVPACL